jgi:hypothetical protein
MYFDALDLALQVEASATADASGLSMASQCTSTGPLRWDRRDGAASAQKALSFHSFSSSLRDAYDQRVLLQTLLFRSMSLPTNSFTPHNRKHANERDRLDEASQINPQQNQYQP